MAAGALCQYECAPANRETQVERIYVATEAMKRSAACG
jgi:hypothetical protein